MDEIAACILCPLLGYACVQAPPAKETVQAPAAALTQELDEVSITATRIERKTAEVPASIAVITEKKIDDTKMFNIKDALAGTPGVLIQSTNQGYDSRLIIRGAGLKAAYGVREIMVLRDGIPVTDPDSFTRLDMIDTQDIQQIEVVKGPNSTLWGANAIGGIINIISKNPMEQSGGMVKLGAGDEDTYNFHLSYANNVADSLYYSGTFSRRQTDNSWRRWNDFDTTQVSIKPYVMLADGSVWENTFSYSDANLQLPGNLDEEMFVKYRDSGEANQTAGPWQYSGRYSDTYFFSTKLTKEFGRFDFIPLAYATYWKQHHPVTGKINDAETWEVGTDLQFNYKHELIGRPATMAVGFTARYSDQQTEYYQYADTVLGGRTGTEILEVTSDDMGDHMETQSKDSLLYGVYVQESFQPLPKTIVDVGARVDQIEFDIDSDWTSQYDYASKGYVDGAGSEDIDKKYTAFSPRIGVTYELFDGLHVFGSISTGIQSPDDSELSNNRDLDMVEARSYEAGLKGRGERWSFDTSVYYSPVKNEVVRVLNPDGQNEYVNAGKTDKRGFEFSGSYTLLEVLGVGASYAYSDYTFVSFSEQVREGRNVYDVDRSGKQLPYVPKHQYSLFATYHHPCGFKARVQTYSWGSYYMDNANTEKYEGYDFVTNLMLGYESGRYDFSVIVNNLFDKRYAVEVTKDTAGEKDYTPAAPRFVMARLNIKF